jgi:hypothetical protein
VLEIDQWVDLAEACRIARLFLYENPKRIFGISSIFVRDGRIEIKAVYAMSQANGFTIFVEVKNVGGASSTLEEALLNGKMCDSEQFPLTVLTGQSAVVKLNLPASQGIQSGVVVQIELRTSDGITCSTIVVLP